MAKLTARPQVFVVVLTGGIASGKTTVANQFSALGVPIVDTDEIAREIVGPGSSTLDAVIEHFGKGLLLPNGELDRRQLREIIFTDPGSRARVEEIMHPEIARLVNERIRSIAAPYCILVVPLYVESSIYGWGDRVLVVDVPEEIQLKRVMARDRISRKHAMRILNAQASREHRKSVAHDIIDNSGDRAGLKREVLELHLKYMAACRSCQP